MLEINGAAVIAKAITNAMQIAWNEWLFNYFSLVIYYRLGNLFLHLREPGAMRKAAKKVIWAIRKYRQAATAINTIGESLTNCALHRIELKLFSRSSRSDIKDLIRQPSALSIMCTHSVWKHVKTTINYRSQSSNTQPKRYHSHTDENDATGSGSAGSAFH